MHESASIFQDGFKFCMSVMKSLGFLFRGSMLYLAGLIEFCIIIISARKTKTLKNGSAFS